MHHGTCVTHVPWCMSGSLTCGDGENVPGIPGACAPAILCIWQEAHGRGWWWCVSSMWLMFWYFCKLFNTALKYWNFSHSSVQIRDPEEKLTEVLFSKYILSTHAEMQGLKIERGMAENKVVSTKKVDLISEHGWLIASHSFLWDVIMDLNYRAWMSAGWYHMFTVSYDEGN